jgi:hypothetical protein
VSVGTRPSSGRHRGAGPGRRPRAQGSLTRSRARRGCREREAPRECADSPKSSSRWPGAPPGPGTGGRWVLVPGACAVSGEPRTVERVTVPPQQCARGDDQPQSLDLLPRYQPGQQDQLPAVRPPQLPLQLACRCPASDDGQPVAKNQYLRVLGPPRPAATAAPSRPDSARQGRSTSMPRAPTFPRRARFRHPQVLSVLAGYSALWINVPSACQTVTSSRYTAAISTSAEHADREGAGQTAWRVFDQCGRALSG